MTLSVTIAYLFPGINLAPGGDCEIVEGEIAAWRLPTPQPTQDEIDAAAPAAQQAAKISAIKVGARARILARLPEWKQANMTARAVELVSLGQASGPEWEAMQAAWNWIKAVRAHSDALEAAVQQSNDPASVDIETGWPE